MYLAYCFGILKMTQILARSFDTTKQEQEEIEIYVVDNVLGQKAIANWITMQLRKHFYSVVSKDKKNHARKDKNNDVNSKENKNSYDDEEVDDDNEDNEDIDCGVYGRDEQELIDLTNAAIDNISPNDSDNKCYLWLHDQGHLPTAQIKIGMTQFAQYDNARKSKTFWSTVHHNDCNIDISTKSKSLMKKQKQRSKIDSNDVMNDMASVVQLKNAPYWEALKKDYTKLRDKNLLGPLKDKHFNGKINDTMIATSTRLLKYTYDRSDVYICCINLVLTVADQQPYHYPAVSNRSPCRLNMRPLTKKILLFPLHGNDHYSLVCFWRLDLLLTKSSDESCILWLDSHNNYHYNGNKDWSNIRK